MNEDGTMARLPDLRKLARKIQPQDHFDKGSYKIRLKNETLIERIVDVNLPTKYGSFDMIAYRQITTNEIHLALVKGKWEKDEVVMVRVHSSCVTGDIFGSFVVIVVTATKPVRWLKKKEKE